MRVEILASTIEPEYTCAAAMRSTRTKKPADEIMLKDEDVARLLRLARKQRHFGVFEHATFSVAVSGISRTCTHQLVRHRLASYLQQSFRETEPEKWVLPLSMTSANIGTDLYNHVVTTLDSLFDLYGTLVKAGVPKEDARFVLPMATETHIVITMNARNWLHFFWMRFSPQSKAQWEIKEIARMILEKLREIAPVIFEEVVEC